MENLELCEKLVHKTGVSYAQAKNALAKNNWDILDAMIFLEEEGIIPSAGSSCSDASAQNAESAQNENTRNCADSPTQENRNENRNCCREKQERRSNAKEEAGSFFRKVWDFLRSNRVIALNNVGKEVLNVPVWAAILVFLCTFWVTTILVLISFIKGWQYRFSGPELGKDGVNKASGAFGSAVYRAGQEIKSSFKEKKNNNENNQGQDCGPDSNYK